MHQDRRREFQTPDATPFNGHQPRRSQCVFSVYDNDPTSWHTPHYVPSSGNGTRFRHFPTSSTLEDYYTTEEGLAGYENSFLRHQETNRKRSCPADANQTLDDIIYATYGHIDGAATPQYYHQHDSRPVSRYEFDGRTSL